MLIHDLRRDATYNLRPDFAMNHPEGSNAKIIVGGNNFVGGSSREAAVHALDDYGIGCAIHSRSVTSLRKTGPRTAVAHIRYRRHSIAMERPRPAKLLKGRDAEKTMLRRNEIGGFEMPPFNQSWRFRQCNGRS
jgi:Aconitase C-terminal domain